MLTLAVEKRDVKGKTALLRKDGKLPAVFYGPKEPSTPIVVLAKDFSKIWKEAGETTVIGLKGDGIEVETLIYDVDSDPVTGMFRHADFYAIEKGKKLSINVPLQFVGVAPAVKDLGGILVKVLHEVKIEALPKDFPHDLEVDISGLALLDSQILARDLHLPNGVTLAISPEEVVASISVPKEEPEEPAAPIDLTAIEVEKKGKKEEEGSSVAAEGEALATKGAAKASEK